MNRLTGFTLLYAMLVTPPVCAQKENSDTPGRADKFRAEIDALARQHEYARADDLVRRQLENGADPAATYFETGKIYFDHEDWQHSSTFLEKCLQTGGANDAAHRLLGLDYRALHRPEEAEAQLLEAAKERPSDRVNAYFAGHQLLLNGKSEAALPYLYSALDSKPLESQALQALALVQARLGNYGLAESYYYRAIDSAQTSDDDRFASLLNLSVLLLLGHDATRLEQGLSCAQRAQQLHPDSPEAHFLSGKALFKLGRLPQAVLDLTRAVKLNPEDSRPHFMLASIYEQLGQHDLAEIERKEVARTQGRPGLGGMSTDGPLP
jgi:Flp pilus assembly protein TadD